MPILIYFLFIILSIPANAMQREVSLEQLVEKSDVIAVVDVIATKSVGTLPSGAQVVANLVKVDQPLKGGVAVGENLKLKTRAMMEDNATFQNGTKVLLFLRRVDNYFEVNFGLCGYWPIDENGKLTGYGSGKTIKDVEAVIAAPADSEKKSKKDRAISL